MGYRRVLLLESDFCLPGKEFAALGLILKSLTQVHEYNN
jgi:hypothetical protein